MAVQLSEIVQAIYSYQGQKISKKVFGFTATSGPTINAGEKFTFSFEVANADALDGGVQLVNVSYKLSVDKPAKASLIVPPVSVGKAMTHPVNGQTLNPGDEVTYYHLFLQKWFLQAGDVTTINNLEGITKAAGGNSIILQVNSRIGALHDYGSSGHGTGSFLTV